MSSIARLAIACAVVLTAPSAYADQCEWITRTQAQDAANWLNAGKEMVAFCKPCDDAKARHLQLVSARVIEVDRKAGYFAVTVHTKDGRSETVDLAYTYVPAGGVGYRNLASLVQCPATDVPMRIDRHGAELPDSK